MAEGEPLAAEEREAAGEPLALPEAAELSEELWLACALLLGAEAEAELL